MKKNNSMNSLEVKIDTKLNMEDYKQFSITHSKKSFIIEFLISFIIFVGGIFTVLIRENYKIKDIIKFGSFLTGVGVIAIVIFISIHYFLFIMKVKKTFNNNEILKEERIYNIKNNGIIIKSNSINQKIDWKYISKIKEGKHTFIIYVSKKNALPIPKRFFDNSMDEKIFKDIVATKVPKSKIK